MEMPISIMITLFVAIVVGTLIIAFAKEAIRPPPDIIPRPSPGENLISLAVLTDGDVVDLADECIKKFKSVAIKRELCFQVAGKSSEIVVDNIYNELVTKYENKSIEIDIGTEVVDNDYSLYIYFNPARVKDTLEISRNAK